MDRNEFIDKCSDMQLGADMQEIRREKYLEALDRVEKLLPLVDDNTPADDKNVIELMTMAEIVIAFEKKHYPINRTILADK